MYMYCIYIVSITREVVVAYMNIASAEVTTVHVVVPFCGRLHYHGVYVSHVQQLCSFHGSILCMARQL